MSAPTHASKVSDYFLWLARENGDLLTNKKLQKLLYYAQGWNLALHGEPLFPEELQAWVHGPVQPGEWLRFAEHGWNAIPGPAEPPHLDPAVRDHLEEVMLAYGGISAFELSQMAHREGPWRAARGGLPPDEDSTAKISLEEMRTFFEREARVPAPVA